MSKKYSKYWFEIYEIMSKAQKKIYEKVEEMCRELEEDLKEDLEELSNKYGFTYVIMPKESNSSGYDCKPCIFIEAHEHVVKLVEKTITQKHPDIISDARLVFEHKIPNILLEKQRGEKT